MLIKKMLKKAILNMKCQHTKMLCLSLYCLLSSGCGKKIQDQKKGETSDSLPLYSSTLSVKAFYYKNGDSLIGNLDLSKSAWVQIPEFLQVIEGNSGNQKARLYFNVRDDEYEFFCEYQGGADSKHPNDEEEIARGLKYELIDCYQDVDDDGAIDVLNYAANTEVWHAGGNKIILEIQGSDDRSDNVTEAEIDIEYL